MANVGLTEFRYSILTEAEDGTPTYAGVKKPGKAISCNLEVTNNSATLYADDGLVESDTSFQSGTVTMNIDDDEQKTMAELLGHTVTEDGQITRKVDDAAPYVGLGHVVTKMVGGKYKYKVEFLYKVKFSEPNQENTTKGESTEFATPEIEGMVSALKNGKWSESKTFDVKNNAVAWLEGCLGRQVQVQYNLNGGGGNLPEAVQAIAGRLVRLVNGEGLVAPGENLQFLGWNIDREAVEGLAEYIPYGDAIMYAIWGARNQEQNENQNQDG